MFVSGLACNNSLTPDPALYGGGLALDPQSLSPAPGAGGPAIQAPLDPNANAFNFADPSISVLDVSGIVVAATIRKHFSND